MNITLHSWWYDTVGRTTFTVNSVWNDEVIILKLYSDTPEVKAKPKCLN